MVTCSDNANRWVNMLPDADVPTHRQEGAMWRYFVSLSALVLAVGCAHSSQITWKIDNVAGMKSTLANHIPRGTGLAEAQQFMEREGFTCKFVRGGAFIEKSWFGDKEPLHKGIDFVHCERTQSAGLMMGSIWDVALVHDGEVVTDVLVSHYVDGP